jgi:hypothetical protein
MTSVLEPIFCRKSTKMDGELLSDGVVARDGAGELSIGMRALRVEGIPGEDPSDLSGAAQVTVPQICGLLPGESGGGR